MTWSNESNTCYFFDWVQPNGNKVPSVGVNPLAPTGEVRIFLASDLNPVSLEVSREGSDDWKMLPQRDDYFFFIPSEMYDKADAVYLIGIPGKNTIYLCRVQVASDGVLGLAATLIDWNGHLILPFVLKQNRVNGFMEFYYEVEEHMTPIDQLKSVAPTGKDIFLTDGTGPGKHQESGPAVSANEAIFYQLITNSFEEAGGGEFIIIDAG